jgi:hypothetical protein
LLNFILILVIFIVIVEITLRLFVHVVGDDEQENTGHNSRDHQLAVPRAVQDCRRADEQNTK